MSEKVQTLVSRDLAHIWHPCTQMKDHEQFPLIPIKSGQGVWLEDFEGRRFIDAISSWWVNIFGHANPYINQKVTEQLANLEHVIFAGFTHEPIITLSKRLVELTPEGLTKCFYADNGSTAVEAALKMSFQAHKNQGSIRPLFVSLTNSYHGETIGTLSVGDVSLYKEVYHEILIETAQVPVPKDMSEASAREAAEALSLFLDKEGYRTSALIVEPLIQCAGLMHMYHPLYLTLAKRLCEKHGVHFIADEIAVGFGRTGTMFACEQSGITPDFMCLSKGITGGYLPLSVVMTSDAIYDIFYDDYFSYKAFLQSHSYTGNPLACAAANATLDLFERDNVLHVNQEKSALMATLLEPFKALPNVKEVRQKGMVAAVELQGYDVKERVGMKVFEYGLDHGVLLRPLGHVTYFMPPFVISDEEMRQMIGVAYEGIKRLIR